MYVCVCVHIYIYMYIYMSFQEMHVRYRSLDHTEKYKESKNILTVSLM